MFESAGRQALLSHVVVLLALALAGGLLFHRVLSVGFWSPEDFAVLRVAADAQTRGELPLVFPPSLAGGYPVNPIFAIEFKLFGLEARPYYVVNLVVHVANAFFAFLLVRSLLHSARSAFVASLLFVLSVGSYGKNLMFAAGISSLLYATACLLGTLLYVQNEKRNAGRPLGLWALAFYVVFVFSLFMKGGTFSILACALFYNLFFRRERRRPVLHTNLVVCLLIAGFAHVVRAWVLGEAGLGGDASAGTFLHNVPGYLVLMVFPLQRSELLETSPALIRTLYGVAPVIRVLVGLTILSYSVFGFIFGGRAIRFYIMWMYVLIVPFALFRYPTDWLNLRFLYLVSLSFCVLLTTGSAYAYGLLSHRGPRRFIPFLVPVAYVFVSVLLVVQLNRKNRLLAEHPQSLAARARIAATVADR